MGKGALWVKWSVVGRNRNIMAAKEKVSLDSDNGDGVDDVITEPTYRTTKGPVAFWFG
jgi:hypothetical protein